MENAQIVNEVARRSNYDNETRAYRNAVLTELRAIKGLLQSMISDPEQLKKAPASAPTGQESNGD